jgi:hypothetical protein
VAVALWVEVINYVIGSPEKFIVGSYSDEFGFWELEHLLLEESPYS